MKPVSTFRHWHTKGLMCVLIMLMVAICARGQDREQKVFEVVPEQLRARLIERLKLYVEYQRTKQDEKLYDLYSETTIARVFKGQDKTQFVAAFKKGDDERVSVRILEFTPIRVEKTTEDDVDYYNIYGEAKLCQQGELVEREIVIGSQLKNGDWYFSEMATVLQN